MTAKQNTALVQMEVEGMDCDNCARSITRFLERKGLQDVYVNFQTKEVRFHPDETVITYEEIKKGIHKLGYEVVEPAAKTPWWTLERKLLFSAIFTTPLLLHHVLMSIGLHIPFMHLGWVQLSWCLPVFTLGAIHFGGSAWRSLRSGVPNMDVLIALGGIAAFIYSLVGVFQQNPAYFFFETTSVIFTLVFVGNWLEKRAVQQTTTAIGELSQLQVATARRVMPSGELVDVDLAKLELGYILQVNTGDKAPADGKLTHGRARVDESMLTGESLPVFKELGAEIIGGSVVVEGSLQMEVNAIGRQSVLGQMIELIKTAQQDKPPLQRLADKISAVFVPVVTGLSVLTFLVGYFVFQLPMSNALMNSIAVLVISCPCAMGLATPTAVMVGVGRLARNGVLVKGGTSVETLAKIKNMVFDKTGTLTSGQFVVSNLQCNDVTEQEARTWIYGLEKHSSHPIARSVAQQLEHSVEDKSLVWQQVEEIEGIGMKGENAEGVHFAVGSARILDKSEQDSLGQDAASLYLTRAGKKIAQLQLDDELKPDAAEAIKELQAQGLNIVVLSGDRAGKTAQIAQQLGIKTFYGEQLPAQKLERIAALTETGSTAMVGDGINDAPALAKATIGVSLSNASQVAIQSAQIVLLDGKLSRLPIALAISKLTLKTIRENLFWAFAYNVVAIPIAAMGYLNPMWGALFMAASDVVVIGNSIRLKYRRS
jgi:Cu+-exporting ATPase